ncbi:phospholipase D family protein [Lamprobacter modestohalophilus]|uniref:phospholipase D family protein n=1 Tax=Lamprobacter modestohalophilus TaxID=1064514 RepID=UPI002ADEB1A1|nr:phospholipase D family protein [Lamprobacter modestohalophilus]MEA1052761.1 phospholipase D family protein [Lamprobacter modestohalophilus]
MPMPLKALQEYADCWTIGILATLFSRGRKMELIYKNDQIKATIRRLINDYSDICFAVAWASKGNVIYDLLRNKHSSVVFGVIGTHFYQTHPDVLDTFCASDSVRFVLQPEGVFHPKLYLFRSESRWAVFMGSANLTTAAFSINSEAMLLIEGTTQGSENLPGEVETLIRQYWNSAEIINKREVSLGWSGRNAGRNFLLGIDSVTS